MSAIDLDGHHRRQSGPAGRQFAAAVPSGLLVPLLDPFRTACGGDALHVSRADFNPSQVQGESSVREGVQPGSSRRDPLPQRGAIAVLVQTQPGPQGGKSPGPAATKSLFR